MPRVRATSWLTAAALACAPSAYAEKPSTIPNLDVLYDGLAPSIVTIRTLSRTGVGLGTGVVLHKDGFIATAAHVVEDGEKIRVDFSDGSKQKATIVTLSRTEDLALLKVPSIPKLTYVPQLADSDQLRVGEPIFCIGTPLGLDHTVTTGIISALRDNMGNELQLHPKRVIQTDASINQGNSGGALFNSDGDVIGIASFIASPNGGSIGLGFAVPSNSVRRRLFEHPLPYLGVSLRRVAPKLARILNWPIENALLIEKVKPGTPAAKAGLRGGPFVSSIGGVKLRLGGDLIIAVAGHHPSEARTIGKLLEKLKSGESVEYTIARGGKVGKIKVPIGDRINVPSLAPAKARKRARFKGKKRK